MQKTIILVTGACGQIGTELVAALRAKYGVSQVIATDIHDRGAVSVENYYALDVLNLAAMEWMVSNLQITQIYHLAAMLSANGEQHPLTGWDLNMKGLLNVLETARKYKLEKVFWPSSIAVFGPGSPRVNCPQNAVTDPVTVYGISKVAGEYWCRYYRQKYAIDIRSLRYPGLISYTAAAGGGTTDYAVEIFEKAVADGAYTCFLEEDTRLPMLYMPDAISATLALMGADKENLGVDTSYNLGGLDFTPAELAIAISRQLPGFEIDYQPDTRQQIAESWPKSIDDHEARRDWGWKPVFELKNMVGDMLGHLSEKHNAKITQAHA